MIEINTVPTAELNASKVAIQLNSAQEFGMQFSVNGFGKYTDAEGNETWGAKPSRFDSAKCNRRRMEQLGSDVDDATYVGDLALAQLGLERAPVEEAPAAE